jgi:hypothetical protein
VIKGEIMPFREKIPGCFGSMDKKFAGHALDVDRAKTMLIEALQETQSLAEFENAIKNYLVQEGCKPGHIAEQMTKVRDIGSYFTYD